MNSNHFPQNEKIGFLRKTTLVDFPEHIACAVFLIGCNLRCPYCYNKDLVLINENSQKDDFSTLDEVFKHLELRKNVLSGITISGGEPLLHPATPLIIKYAKNLGYKIKLDTNGTNPLELEKLIKNDQLCPDYVAMDIKASSNCYSLVTGVINPFLDNIKESINILKKFQSGSACSPRTPAQEIPTHTRIINPIQAKTSSIVF